MSTLFALQSLIRDPEAWCRRSRNGGTDWIRRDDRRGGEKEDENEDEKEDEKEDNEKEDEEDNDDDNVDDNCSVSLKNSSSGG